MCEVNADHDPESVLRLVADGVVDGVGFGVAAISYLRPDRMLEVVAVSGSSQASDQLLGRRRPLAELDEEFAVAETWGTLRFVAAEAASLPATGWVPEVDPLDGPDAWQPEDLLFAPLCACTGELLGVLSVDLPEDGRRPGRDQRELLEMYAVQAGIALDNARKHRQLEEQVRLADGVRSVHHAATSLLELGHVIDTCLAPIVAGLRCDAAWLRVFEGQGELPGRGRGAIHPPERTLVPPDRILAMAWRVALACWQAQSVGILAPDAPPPEALSAEEVGEVLRFIARAGSNYVAVVPVGAGSDCLGYMVLSRRLEDGPWTDLEEAAGLEIGRDLGRAVLHARLFEREQRLVAELGELDAYKSELLATVSHELKNPLSAVLGYVELLEDDSAPGQAHEYRAIRRNVGRMTRLVDDLLLLSRLANPAQPLRGEPVDLGGIVRVVVDDMSVQASQRQIDLHLAPVPATICVDGEASDLERAVVNLLSNAVKYSPPGSRVHVTVRSDGATGLVEVRDEGLGISVADQAELFGEFFRSADPLARAEPGTGLGLSIVKRIAERHRGRVDVASELGRGSTFTLALPLTTQSC
jgi:signal transduction histidine kinase